MKSNIAPNAPGLARAVTPRYLQVAGAFAVGGAFTRVGSKKLFVPIPSLASVELPLTGGLSIAKASKVSFGGSKKLLAVASASARIESKHVARNRPKGNSIEVLVDRVK